MINMKVNVELLDQIKKTSKNKPFSVARKSLYNFTGSAKLCSLAENKNPIAIKGQLSQKHVYS